MPPPRVVDATAGLGADSHLLAALGCQVIAIERSPVVAAVLRDGIARAGTPVELLLGDAIGILAELSTDVVTLDPMFPPGKSALAKKPSQYLQALLGQPADTAELFAAARAAARRRVVVKRPRIGPPLVESPRPSHCHEGKSVRFDVYLAG